MNFEQRLDNQLEHWFELPLMQKIKTGGTLVACCALAMLAVAVFVAGAFVLPDFLMELI